VSTYLTLAQTWRIGLFCVQKAVQVKRKTAAMAYYRTPHDVTALPAWQALKDHRQAMQDFSMREAFNADPQRSISSPSAAADCFSIIRRT